MPKYLNKERVNDEINKEEAYDMITRAKNPRDRALIAFLYLTGARPCEAVEIQGKHFENKDGDIFILSVNTAKKNKKFTGFDPDRRRLEIPRTAPLAEFFLDYVSAIEEEEKMFNISTTRVRQIIYQVSNDERPPYAMRHNRLTKLANEGASLSELMYWKGANDAKSVSPYIAHKPIGRKLTFT